MKTSVTYFAVAKKRIISSNSMNPIQFGLCVGAFLFLLGCCGISTLFAFKDRIAQLDIKPLLWRRNRLWNEVASPESGSDVETGLIQSRNYQSTNNNNNQSFSNRSSSLLVCNFITKNIFLMTTIVNIIQSLKIQNEQHI